MTDTSLLQETWHEYRTEIDAALEGYLDIGPQCPERLREAMQYSLMAGGKRLRPLLVLLACEACGGKAEDALPAACAIEMVQHLFADPRRSAGDGRRRSSPRENRQTIRFSATRWRFWPGTRC